MFEIRYKLDLANIDFSKTEIEMETERRIKEIAANKH